MHHAQARQLLEKRSFLPNLPKASLCDTQQSAAVEFGALPFFDVRLLTIKTISRYN